MNAERRRDACGAALHGRCRSLDELSQALRCLPGVGPKAAQRMALHLLQHDRDGAQRLAQRAGRRDARRSSTASAATRSPKARSARCAGRRKRDAAQLCVVETPADLLMVEQTQAYSGLYFVLMGRLSPLDGIGPQRNPARAAAEARHRRRRARSDPRDQLHQRRRGDRALHRRAARPRASCA